MWLLPILTTRNSHHLRRMGESNGMCKIPNKRRGGKKTRKQQHDIKT